MGVQFSVEVEGAPCLVAVDRQCMALGVGDDAPDQMPWSELSDMAFPTSVSARLNFDGREPLVLRFLDRDDRDAFRPWAERKGDVDLAAAPATPTADDPGRFALPAKPLPAPPVPMHTLPGVPGREVIESLGLVTAQSVMSRGFFSDTGSDLKSVLGGNLKGMEKALGDAIKAATADLSAVATSLGADAVVGVTVSVAGVGDKAEAIIVARTAVRTTPSRTVL